MKAAGRLWRRGEGWSKPLPGEMDSARTLVLAFGAADGDDAQAFDDLTRAFPQAVLLGCSTAGEIHAGSLHDASVSVAVAAFDHTDLRAVHTPVAGAADSAAAGERLAHDLAGEGLRAVFLLGDGVAVNGAALAEGLSSQLPPEVLISGGLAGDGDRFQRTWVLADRKRQGAQVQAVGFYGPRLQVHCGCEGGWQDFGPARRITRAEGAVLHLLDDKPALDLYRLYLGDRANELPGAALLFPLSISPPGGTDRPLVRTILGIDEQARSLTFAGDMPEGWEARLMRSSPDRLILSAEAAASQALAGHAGLSPTLLVSVSCVGRRLVLGERTEEELEGTLDGAPPGSVHVGFYSYGEIATLGGRGGCQLHNQTMTITAFSEA